MHKSSLSKYLISPDHVKIEEASSSKEIDSPLEVHHTKNDLVNAYKLTIHDDDIDNKDFTARAIQLDQASSS